jgi:hypothetical protein
MIDCGHASQSSNSLTDWGHLIVDSSCGYRKKQGGKSSGTVGTKRIVSLTKLWLGQVEMWWDRYFAAMFFVWMLVYNVSKDFMIAMEQSSSSLRN